MYSLPDIAIRFERRHGPVKETKSVIARCCYKEHGLVTEFYDRRNALDIFIRKN